MVLGLRNDIILVVVIHFQCSLKLFNVNKELLSVEELLRIIWEEKGRRKRGKGEVREGLT